jgi:hypothetical protein
MATEAVLVPDLNGETLIGIRHPNDLHIVEPLLTCLVPGWRQDDDTAVLQRGEIVLDTPIAESVVHTTFDLFSGEVGLGSVIAAVTVRQFVAFPA